MNAVSVKQNVASLTASHHVLCVDSLSNEGIIAKIVAKKSTFSPKSQHPAKIFFLIMQTK